MKHRSLWLIVALIMASPLLTGCGQPPKGVTASGEHPASVTPIPGTKLHQVVLSEQAFKRLDIQTAPVTEEPVTRKWLVGGIVGMPDPPPANSARQPGPGGVWVSVRLSVDDLNRVERSQSVQVLPLTGEEKSVPAQPAGAASEEVTAELYYVVDSAGHGLVDGDRVQVELTLAGSGTQRKVVPYAAVIFDTHGDTWVYTTTAPRTFVRQSVTVDYVTGGLAVVSDGPSIGTMVVTLGAGELFGTEFGVGH